jgi:hypothetical protein
MDWSNILSFAAAFVSTELAALFVFYLVRQRFDKKDPHPFTSALKGIMERFAVLLGLAANIPTIIVFFGALKLGTRLKEQQESKISNDYFLIGNIISITIAIAEFLIYQQLNECWGK